MSVGKKYRVEPKLSKSNKYFFGDVKNFDNYIYLGKLAEIGPNVDVYFTVSSSKVVSVVGKRGSGKSYTLGSLLESLCTDENNSKISNILKKQGIVLFDTLNIFWTSIIPLSKTGTDIVKKQFSLMERWGLNAEKLNVMVWVPAGFRTDSMPESVEDFYINTSDFEASDWASLLNVDLILDRMGQLINEVYVRVTEDGWKDISNEHYSPSKVYAIEDLIRCIDNDPELNQDYHRETIRAVTQQLKYYGNYELFKKEGTDLTELVKPGVLSILLMNQLPDDLRTVLASVLIKKILRSRSLASFIEKRLAITSNITNQEKSNLEKELLNYIDPLWIAVDEAQNLFPSHKRTSSSEIFVKLVREGRNFSISIIFTTQQPSAIDSRIMAQVDTFVIHKLAMQKDIDDVLKNIKSRVPREIHYGKTDLSFQDMIRDVEVGQAIISSTDASRSFILGIRPRVSVHGGFEI